jgi:uncharacterized protein YjdB
VDADDEARDEDEAGAGDGTELETTTEAGEEPGDDAVPEDGDAGSTVRELAVTPARSELPGRCRPEDPPAVGHLTALATLVDGATADVTPAAAWRSSDESIATVEEGRVTAVAIGFGTSDVEITATYGGVTSEPVLVIVRAHRLESITVLPAEATLRAESTETVALTATGRYPDASTVGLTERAVWTSSDETVATVSNEPGSRGVVSPAGSESGEVRVTAAYGGVTSSPAIIDVVAADVPVSVEVDPPTATIFLEGTRDFTATAVMRSGSRTDVSGLAEWISTDPSVATVDASGTAVGLSEGATDIIATYDALSGTARVVVASPRIVSLTVAPSTAYVTCGTSQPFTATVTLEDGRTLDVTTTAVWASEDWCVASMFGATASTYGEGTTTITATADGITGTASLHVCCCDGVESITVTPSAPRALCPGETLAFTATGNYADGSHLDLTRDAWITWRSSVPPVADISNDWASKGITTAIAPGPTLITARYSDGVCVEMTSSPPVLLTVVSGVLERLTVSPDSATVAAGSTVALAATVHDSCGGDADVTDAASWTSSDETVATVSSTGPSGRGIVTGIAPGGPVTITAAVGGLTGSAAVTVTP